MSHNYAIINNNKIVNVIVADSKESAESITGMDAIFIGDQGSIGIDWELIDDEWRPPSPYISWIWDNLSKQWISPVPIPEDNKLYSWNENIGKWEEIIS